MAWIAAVLAVFLFYKFVERRHKIIAFKIAGALSVLGLVVFLGAAICYRVERAIDANRDPEITVEYTRSDFKLPKVKQRQIALAVLDDYLKEHSYQFTGIPTGYISFIQYTLVGRYLDEKPPFGEHAKISKAEIDAMRELFEDNPETKADAEERLEKAEEIRYLTYVENLESLIKTWEAKNLAPIIPYIVNAQLNSLGSERKRRYEKDLLNYKRIVDGVLTIRSMKDEVQKEVVKRFNASDGEAEISFRICNKKQSQLDSYYFYASGLEEGRSTEHTLDKIGVGSSTRFEGDIIIPGNKCTTLNWTGRYRIFDRYKLDSITGRWADD